MTHPIRSALASLADIPAERAPKAKPRGYKLRTYHDRKVATLLTDEQVLAARAAYEFDGAKARNLALQYGVSRSYMYHLLTYQTRSKLIPERHKHERPVFQTERRVS
ncbi:hypothetical protein [Paraburkholderia phenoliruptrix]|uniref:hypothetical protein n=1 Tax=Paraburkholderia phenoliruptrix TaxID=252970 RepID=UPI0034CD5020